MLKSSLKLFRVLNDSLALRDMTNIINLEVVILIVKSRQQNRNRLLI